MPDKVITPGIEQTGGPKIDYNKIPEETRDFVKNKLGEDAVLNEETIAKLGKSYREVEKKIGEKKETVLEDFLKNPDSEFLEKMKQKIPSQTQGDKIETSGSSEEVQLTEDEKRELKEIFAEAQTEKSKELFDKLEAASKRLEALDSGLSFREQRMQKMDIEENMRNLDGGYRELASQVGETNIAPYIDKIQEILIDEKTGGPRVEFSGFYQTRNPVRTALIQILANTGANPELLMKLSQPIHSEGAGYTPGLGKASGQNLSKSDRDFLAATEMTEKEKKIKGFF